jgi:hypothetical protein
MFATSCVCPIISNYAIGESIFEFLMVTVGLAFVLATGIFRPLRIEMNSSIPHLAWYRQSSTE